MEDRIEEGLINGAEEIKPLEETELKNLGKCICKINGKEKIGTGFFCKITIKDKLVPVLITNNHVINDEFLQEKKQLKFYIGDESQIINIDSKRKIYSSESNEYDIMIIKLKEADEINNFLEIDKNIFKNNSEKSYEDEQIYILHYPRAGKASVSYGKGIEQLNDFDIKHLCNTESGSSGGPILSLMTNKIIGIHKGAIKKGYNIGTFLKFPLNELNQVKQENKGNKEDKENKKDKENKENKENEEFSKKKDKIENEIKIFNGIKMEVKVGENDINEDIYFLDNTHGTYDNIKHYHDNLKELNKLNTELYINNEKFEFKKYFKPNKKGIYSIILNFKISLTDCSFMFFQCSHLQNIDFVNFDVKNVVKMNNMFSYCYFLKNISNISNWNTKNVTNMKAMFSSCTSLISLPDISQWNTSNVTDMSEMFYICKSLQSLPDISQWDTSNVEDMNNMFYACIELTSLPDLSKWAKTKFTDMRNMFTGCPAKNKPDMYKKKETLEDNNIKTNINDSKKKEEHDKKENESSVIKIEGKFYNIDNSYHLNTIVTKLDEKEVDINSAIKIKSKKYIYIILY